MDPFIMTKVQHSTENSNVEFLSNKATISSYQSGLEHDSDHRTHRGVRCQEQHFDFRFDFAGLYNQRFDVGTSRPRTSPWKA
uniref:Uncharacterized protein n=1 Tax=Oryza barthii TaxID=65489 RepID=A0A0D3FTS0_9ORYZ